MSETETVQDVDVVIEALSCLSSTLIVFYAETCLRANCNFFLGNTNQCIYEKRLFIVITIHEHVTKQVLKKFILKPSM